MELVKQHQAHKAKGQMSAVSNCSQIQLELNPKPTQIEQTDCINHVIADEDGMQYTVNPLDDHFESGSEPESSDDEPEQESEDEEVILQDKREPPIEQANPTGLVNVGNMQPDELRAYIEGVMEDRVQRCLSEHQELQKGECR